MAKIKVWWDTIFLFFLILAAAVSIVADFSVARIVKKTLPVGRVLIVSCPPKCNLSDIKRRMKYHGVLFSWQDKNGTWWFKRKGKDCRLTEVK